MMTKVKRLILSFIFLAVLAACQPAAPQATPVPTEPMLQGQVDITTPLSGSTIYAESLWIDGTADDVPEEGFRLRVMAADDSVLAETTVQPQEGRWLVELVHGYSGDPIEVTIYALAIDERISGDYDIETIVIASQNTRPEGVYGTILAPQSGSTPGGDEIPVTGTASGVFENMFTLVLERPDGTEISSVGVTMTNPYFIDEMVWEATLPTNDYTGPAVIRAYTASMEDGSEIDLGRVEVMISRVAG